MHEIGQLLGQAALSLTSGGAFPGGRVELVDLVGVEERQQLQTPHDVGVRQIEEVLVPGVRRRHLRIEPHVAAAGRLAQLAPLRVGDQRCRQSVHLCAVYSPNEVDPGHDVAPLVGAAHLKSNAVTLEELPVVGRLKQHVAELGVGDPLTLEPALHRLACQHRVDREVLADVPEEHGHAHRTEPVEVVHLDRRNVGMVEVDEPGELAPEPSGPLPHLVLRVQGAFADVPRVADQPGTAAGEQDWPMTCVLKPPEHEHLDEVTGVQARRRRVEARIDGDRTPVQVSPQGSEVGGLRDQTAPGQLVKNVLAHDVHSPMQPKLHSRGDGGSRSVPAHRQARRRRPSILSAARGHVRCGGRC